MKKKYIKPEIKTIKVDTEPYMNITSQPKVKKEHILYVTVIVRMFQL